MVIWLQNCGVIRTSFSQKSVKQLPQFLKFVEIKILNFINLDFQIFKFNTKITSFWDLRSLGLYLSNFNDAQTAFEFDTNTFYNDQRIFE